MKCSEERCLRQCTGLKLVLIRIPTHFHAKAVVIIRGKRDSSKVIENKLSSQKGLINGELVWILCCLILGDGSVQKVKYAGNKQERK